MCTKHIHSFDLADVVALKTDRSHFMHLMRIDLFQLKYIPFLNAVASVFVMFTESTLKLNTLKSHNVQHNINYYLLCGLHNQIRHQTTICVCVCVCVCV